MKKLIIVLALLIGITAACTSGQVDNNNTQLPKTPNEQTLIVLGDKDVFYNNKIIRVASLCDEISSKHANDSTSIKIELSYYVTAGDVFDVTQAVQKASSQKITISEDLSLKILQIELTANGEVIINDDHQISLSALHSHLAALDRSKKVMAFLSAKEQTSAKNVFFAQRMLAKNNIETIIRK